MSCEHGNWPPCELCDALDAAHERGFAAGKLAAYAAPQADQQQGRQFTSADLPETKYSIRLDAGAYVNGYRGIDVIEAVNAWAQRAKPSDQQGASLEGEAVAALVPLAAELASAEKAYRHAHDHFGGGNIEIGRAWDRMRKAGIAVSNQVARARAALASKASPDEQRQEGELPGMWERSDFTGGDPDERSHHERKAASPPTEAASAVGEYADEAMAMHWIDRYAAGIDDYPQLDKIAASLSPTASAAREGL